MNIKIVTLEPALYLVATPIGNLRDITLRALETLESADLILCEDTRVSGKLLKAHGIKTPMQPYHDHSDKTQRKKIIQMLVDRKAIALISDAGTPMVSDPGYKLVRDALDLGLRVIPVPGANAPMAALQLSGLPSDCFSFLGFLPNKVKARKDVFHSWKSVHTTLIFFERASRLQASLSDLLDVMGDRPVAVVREITKMYEESRRSPVSTMIKFYEHNGPPKGEIVVVVGPPEVSGMSDDDILRELTVLLKTESLKDASKIMAERSGKAKKEIYDMGLTIMNRNGS